jgi:hypothetical protein
MEEAYIAFFVSHLSVIHLSVKFLLGQLSRLFDQCVLQAAVAVAGSLQAVRTIENVRILKTAVIVGPVSGKSSDVAQFRNSSRPWAMPGISIWSPIRMDVAIGSTARWGSRSPVGGAVKHSW